VPNLVVFGDTRSGHDAHRAVIDQIRTFQPTAVIHVGDLVNNGWSTADWDSFNAIEGSLIDETDFYPALGNHEYQSDLYFDNFTLPNNEQWYSVDYNGVHFIVLNSCVDLGPSSGQYGWLLADLAAVDQATNFVAVVLHHPPYSTGQHAEDEAGLRETLVPLLELYEVDVVFAGHDHDYERSFCGDIYYVVTGGGGAPLRDQARSHPCSQLFLSVYHFCKLSAFPDRLVISVYDIDRELIDSFSL
jgi:predicted phosphodiesterase